MNSQKYAILRAIPQADHGKPYGGFLGPGGIAEGPSAQSLRVDEDELKKSDLTKLRQDPSVMNVAPIMPVRLIAPTAVANVESITEQGTAWGVSAIKAAQSPFSGEGITVAILDSGIDRTHEAFTGMELVLRDFTGEGESDDNGHGTHCAGTFFGQEVSGFRFGVAPGVKRALIGKVLGRNGGGSTEQIYHAMLWAVESGAIVVSMSLGMDFPGFVNQLVERGFPNDLAVSKALEGYGANIRMFDALMAMFRARGAFSQSAVFVAATGNESKRQIHPDYEITVAPPAAAEGIVAVGALQRMGDGPSNLAVAAFSNTGASLSAPGVGIYSARVGGGYAELSGTSMATPHVAGAAALWAQRMFKETGIIEPSQLIALLIGNAEKTSLAPGFDAMDVGSGLVQAPPQ